MGKLILPGDERAASGLTILVPRGHESGAQGEPTMVCRVPIGPGETCATAFWPGEERAFTQHVTRCAKQHEAEIRNASPRTRLPIFDEATWDPEVSEHLRAVGRRMLKEGRLVMHKSERVGF